jgi:exonuclease VII large subunit
MVILALAFAAYGQNTPAADKVQEAQKKLNDAQKKLEKAEEDFDNAADAMYNNPDYAPVKQSLDGYKSAINDAKKSKAIAEQKANAMFQTAAKLGLKPQLAFQPNGKAIINEAIQDYIDAVGIVYGKQEAIEEAENTYYEKVREYLDSIQKQLNAHDGKPDEKTVVEKLDDAERDVEYAKKEMQDALDAQDAEDARAAKQKAGVKPVQVMPGNAPGMMPADRPGERPAEGRAPSFWDRLGPMTPPMGMGGSGGDSKDRRTPDDRKR